MIRRSVFSLSWQGSACLVAVIAIVGCEKKPQHVELAPLRIPTVAESSGETTAETEEPELAPAATELGGADLPTTVKEPPVDTEPKPVEATADPSAPHAPKVALTVPKPPEYVYEPQALMSQRDADSCLVKTGASFPDALLPDLEGQEHSLKELFGEKLTVVVFWSNSNRLGREQIQRLETETVSPFENSGLSIVAINISDPPEQISDLLPVDRKPGFTVLLDTDAALFSKVATGRHPRTYLLDPAGNVLWYDIEYSRSMARDLANAIHVYLGEPKSAES